MSKGGERWQGHGEPLIPQSTLYSLFMQAPAIICVLRGPNHVFELVNPGYQLLSAHRTLLGRPAREALPEVDQQWFEILDRVYSTGEQYVGREARVMLDRRGTGQLVEGFFNFIYQPMYSKDKRVEGVIVFAFEVTAEVQTRRRVEKRAERSDERLRQSEELFHLLVQSVRDYAIFMLDAGGRVISWNAGARRIKGYDSEEILGRHFSAFYPEEDIRAGRPERDLTLAGERGSVEDEGWRVRKDGGKFWANTIITAVHDQNGNLRGFAKVTRDITERKKAEEMERALSVAQERDRGKDEFIATVSHELRTPLTSILGWARMLRIGGLDAATTREALDALERSAQAQVHLIEDLLDDARISSGKLRLSKRALQLKAIVEAAVADLAPTAEAGKIGISTELTCDPCAIIGDPVRLQQVVWNLISNAIKFTPEGGKIFVRLSRQEAKAVIEVRDTGRGIDPHLLPHIFQRFRQGDAASKDRKGGLGLGLSITHHLVELHGGEVQAWSEGSGKGSTFTVRLPLAPVSSDAFVQREPSRSEDLPTLRGIRILIVEDQADNRDVLAAIVERCGGEPRCSANAADALQLLQSWQPDVIVCDIALPDLDGCDFLTQVRSQFQTPAVALTVLGSSDEQKRIQACGFEVFRQKPIEPADLAHDIARLAGRNELNERKATASAQQ